MTFSNKETTLIICRGLSEASLLSRFRPKRGCCYVVAFDDVEVHRAVRPYPWVDDVCWIEQMESFYAVADDVITILEGVNRWLASLADGLLSVPAELLFWIRHAEGGMTTQRIQDLLLLIRSYQHLLDGYRVHRIVLLRDVNNSWEDDVLIQVGRSKGIAVKEIKSAGYRMRCLSRWVRANTKSAAVVVLNTLRIIRAKLQRGRIPAVRANNQDEAGEDEIAFQLCSSSKKHIENIVPLMEALQRKGYRPVALTWRASQGAADVRREGLHVEELEGWVPISSYWEAPCQVLYTWAKAKNRIKQFFGIPELEYRSVPLGPLLWPSVQYFFKSELLERCQLSEAVKEYFKRHCPVAVKLWGGVSLAQGSITWRKLPQLERPLIIDNWVGIAIDWPYSPKENPTDLFLATGPIQKQCVERDGVASERIVMVGQGRYDHLAVWMKTYTVEICRSTLNIPSDYTFYLFYDPNAVLRGYLTTMEQTLVTNTLLNFARNCPDAALIIKPHPAHQPGMLERLIEHYPLPNVFLINKDMLPYHALMAADVVVTKFSTVGIEAMIFGRPVVSVMLDNEDRWQFVYGDAAEYVKTVNALAELLEKLVDDAEFRPKWTEAQRERQEYFLAQYFIQSSRPAASLAADAIAHRLLKRDGISTQWSVKAQ